MALLWSWETFLTQNWSDQRTSSFMRTLARRPILRLTTTTTTTTGKAVIEMLNNNLDLNHVWSWVRNSASFFFAMALISNGHVISLFWDKHPPWAPHGCWCLVLAPTWQQLAVSFFGAPLLAILSFLNMSISAEHLSRKYWRLRLQRIVEDKRCRHWHSRETQFPNKKSTGSKG